VVESKAEICMRLVSIPEEKFWNYAVPVFTETKLNRPMGGFFALPDGQSACFPTIRSLRSLANVASVVQRVLLHGLSPVTPMAVACAQ
jgi:hypothetical protein